MTANFKSDRGVVRRGGRDGCGLQRRIERRIAGVRRGERDDGGSLVPWRSPLGGTFQLNDLVKKSFLPVVINSDIPARIYRSPRSSEISPLTPDSLQ